MNKLPAPKTKYRITMADLSELPDISGIYILAYMGQILYVGKASGSVPYRIVSHFNNALHENIGAWLRNFESDWQNVRLDILEAPLENFDTWLTNAEIALIRKFKPLFNTNLQDKNPVLVPMTNKHIQLDLLEL
jgi:excinuclease UvrABC nuclease subunit